MVITTSNSQSARIRVESRSFLRALREPDGCQGQAMLQEQSSYVIRFAGDSGDGIQLQGQQFTTASALAGHDLATMPDFPAEIRAPAGTRFGVSAFQIQFGGERITTPGDAPDVLIAFNPAGGPGGQPVPPDRGRPDRRG